MNKNDVFRFDIPMKNFMFVHQRNSFQKITYNERSAFLA